MKRKILVDSQNFDDINSPRTSRASMEGAGIIVDNWGLMHYTIIGQAL